MEREVVRGILLAIGEEILDDSGTVIGYVAQPARFRLSRPYLARGGFLVVSRDEESGEIVGTEFDALPHPKSGIPYPAGHWAEAWRVHSLDEALERVMFLLPSLDVQ